MPDQMPGNGGQTGLLDSIKGLAATGVAIVQTRLQLFSTEVAEEKERFLSLLWLGGAAFFFIGLGIIFAAVFLTVVFWESHRLLVLGIFTVLFIGIGITAMVAAMKAAKAESRLFSASLAELSKDRDNLTSRP